MTKYEFEIDLPDELPDKPDWYDKSAATYLGYDKYTPIPDAIKDADIDTLEKFNAQLKTQLNEFKETYKEFSALKETAAASRQVLENQYLKIVQQIKKFESSAVNVTNDAGPKIEAINSRIDQTSQLINQRLAAKKAEEEYAALLSEWAKLTEAMPWKDIALDHQMKGGQRMAFNRRMILADVMGLGKTLTSIIACDYIKSKTAEGDIHKYSIEYNQQSGMHEPKLATDIPAGRKILYLCPAQLATNVQKEFKKWAEHRGFPLILTGMPRQTRRLLMANIKQMDNDYVVLLNYEAWRKDKTLINDLIECEFDTIILDEAHYLKERESIAYRGVMHLLQGHDFVNEDKGGVQWSAHLGKREPRFIFPMTGTPILNKPQEFYTLLSLVNPKNYPPTNYGERTFLRNYCVEIDYGKYRFAKGGLDALAKKISNLYLRRTLHDAGIQLPPQDIQLHELEIDVDSYPQQAKARIDMREKALLMLEDKVQGRANAVISIYLRLRQIETLPRGIKITDPETLETHHFNVDESQKLDYIIHENGQGYEGLLTEVCPDQRTVIYSQFKEPLHELQSRCEKAGLRSVILDGDTPRELSERIKLDVDRHYVSKKAEENNHIELTQEDYEWDVVLCNYKVGGQGLNFTHMTQTIILDEEWNPGKRDQAYGRTHRMGQTENTTVHVIRMKQTVDTWLAEIIADKELDVDSFNMATEFIKGLREGDI